MNFVQNVLFFQPDISLGSEKCAHLERGCFNVEIGASGFLRLFQIGITLQPVALHRNVYASVVEDMILKVGVRWQQSGRPGRAV